LSSNTPKINPLKTNDPSSQVIYGTQARRYFDIAANLMVHVIVMIYAPPARIPAAAVASKEQQMPISKIALAQDPQPLQQPLRRSRSRVPVLPIDGPVHYF
jgi:hypothetical protein